MNLDGKITSFSLASNFRVTFLLLEVGYHGSLSSAEPVPVGVAPHPCLVLPTVCLV